MSLTCNGFLNDRLRIWQPARGYRAGMDPVLLAAACPARPGQAVLELGCGVGTASLCLSARVPDLDLTGVEVQPDYADLARRNGAENGARFGVVTADLAALPADLRARRFDQVLMNPPYFTPGTTGPDAGRARARQDGVALGQWIDAGLRRLRPGGGLSLIQRSDRLPEVLAALTPRAGAIRLRPLAPRAGAAAARFVLTAIKGRRDGLTLLAPLVIHAAAAHQGDGTDDYTDVTRAILRDGAPLPMDA
ncbi:tRNA1(Val) (adenine(37)-N6)-methyltransferase [Paracoccus sp. p4-l81]|uniref:tRNA1(Val) (adenine(37)-N6)-methyltransferase n=1 Tax=Paracoccus sp. p4-l81 TaxID=3342806 RepID=UPI0035B8F0F9